MVHLLLLLLSALIVGAVAYGVTWIITGRDRGLDPQEPDGRSVALPGTRPLLETDVERLRFDTALRGYRMDQVDSALHRAAYDLGYKQELIDVLGAEIAALRDGREDEAQELRLARESSQPTGRPPLAPAIVPWDQEPADTDAAGPETALDRDDEPDTGDDTDAADADVADNADVPHSGDAPESADASNRDELTGGAELAGGDEPVNGDESASAARPLDSDESEAPAQATGRR
jgi:DivIVA domain-containing protein